MDNLKNKNKSISKSNKSNIYNLPISIDGYDCLGPCYPPNTVFYHPLYFATFKTKDYVCPIKKTVNKNGEKILTDYCDPKDANNDYQDFDIFEDIVQIANTPKSFLQQIYNIKTVEDIYRFLNDSIEELPIYTQKRILNCMYLTYYRNENFPKELFCEKVQKVIKNIYDLNIPIEKISNKIFSDKNIDDVFLFLSNKYSGKKKNKKNK